MCFLLILATKQNNRQTLTQLISRKVSIPWRSIVIGHYDAVLESETLCRITVWDSYEPPPFPSGQEGPGARTFDHCDHSCARLVASSRSEYLLLSFRTVWFRERSCQIDDLMICSTQHWFLVPACLDGQAVIPTESIVQKFTESSERERGCVLVWWKTKGLMFQLVANRLFVLLKSFSSTIDIAFHGLYVATPYFVLLVDWRPLEFCIKVEQDVLCFVFLSTTDTCVMWSSFIRQSMIQFSKHCTYFRIWDFILEPTTSFEEAKSRQERPILSIVWDKWNHQSKWSRFLAWLSKFARNIR